MRYNMKKIFLGVVFCISFGISLADNQQQDCPYGYVQAAPSNDGIFSVALGRGYSTDNKMSTGQIAINNLSDVPVCYSKVQNTIRLENVISRDELSKDLNVDVNVSGGWGAFSADASSSYMRHIDDTRYSDNFTYSELFFKDAYLDISKLPSSIEALAPAAKDKYNNDGVQAFTSFYGDSFVQEVPLGAVLVVNIQVNFNRAYDKENFNAAVKGDFGSIFHASSKIQETVSQSHAKGAVEVSAYQLPSTLPHTAKTETA